MGHGGFKPLHNLRKKVDAGAHGNTYVQSLAVPGTHILSLLHGGFQIITDAPQFSAKLCACRCQIRALTGAFKQEKANFMFKALDLISQGRLADKQVLRRPAEVQRFGQLQRTIHLLGRHRNTSVSAIKKLN